MLTGLTARARGLAASGGAMFSAAALAGCAGLAACAGPRQAPPPEAPPQVAGLPSLAQLPQPFGYPESARVVFKASAGNLLGDAAILQSANADADKVAHTMELACQPGEMSWALYAFPGDGEMDAAFNLQLNLDPPAPQRFWVGHADYYNKRWGWAAVDDSDGSEDLIVQEGEGSFSPANTAYIAVLLYNGTSAPLQATLRDLELSTDNSRGDWWAYGRNAQHCGYSTHTGPAIKAEAWVHPYMSSFYTSPVQAADGTIYLCSNDAQLHAVGPDGSLKWMAPVPGHSYSTPAVGRDGAIYVGGGDSRLYAYNSDGSERWNLLLLPPGEWETSSLTSPIVIGERGTVYVFSEDGNLYAVDPSGTQAWHFYVQAGISPAPAPALGSDGTLYVGSFQNRLYALNPSGTERWRFAADSAVISTPAVAPDGAIVFNTVNWIYSLNPDGSQRHPPRGAGMYTYSQGPAIGPGGMIYLGGSQPGQSAPEYGCFAFNPDLTLAWHFNSGSGHLESRAAVDAAGTIYLGEYSNLWGCQFHALNPDGTSKWQYPLPSGAGGGLGTPPAVGKDGSILVPAGGAGLAALGPGW